MSLDHLLAYFSNEEEQSIQEDKKDLEEQHSPILTAHIERNEQLTKLLKETADNIRTSEKLRSKITKDIKGKAALEDILKDCIECISLMTGDKTYYKQNINNLDKR